MEKKIIERVVLLTEQLRELESLKKRNFKDFAIGTYNEDFKSFLLCKDKSREILVNVKNRCAHFFTNQIELEIDRIKKELEEL